MDSAVRTTLQASSRLAVRMRPCHSCSSYALIHPPRPTRSTRYYTTTPRRNAIGETGLGAAARMGREVLSQMSDSGAQTRSVSKAQMQKDLGLLPGTFTHRPLKDYLPLLKTEPKFFFRLAWKLMKKPFTNTFGYVLLFLSPSPLLGQTLSSHSPTAYGTTSTGFAARASASPPLPLSARSPSHYT